MTADVDRLIADSLLIPLESVVDSLEYRGVPEWDSAGHLRLILALEDALGVTIDDDRVTELTSVAAVRAFATASRRP